MVDNCYSIYLRAVGIAPNRSHELWLGSFPSQQLAEDYFHSRFYLLSQTWLLQKWIWMSLTKDTRIGVDGFEIVTGVPHLSKDAKCTLVKHYA